VRQDFVGRTLREIPRPFSRPLLAWLAVAGAVAAQEPATWPQLLERREFAALTAAVAAADERRRAGELDFRAFRRLTHALSDLPAEKAPQFDAWVAAAGAEDGIPLLVRALFFNAQGWKARGNRFARETSPDQFARMHASFDRAAADAEWAKAKLQRCDACYALLLDMAKARGQRTEAAALLDEAMKADPRAVAAPEAYLEGLEPRWGGRPGEAREFVGRFKQEYPTSPARPVLEANLLVEAADPHFAGKRYGEAAVLLQQAIDLDPHRYRTLYRLAYSQGMLKQYDRALANVDASLAIVPNRAEAHALRGWILAEQGRAAEALPDLERAAGLGDTWALREALLVYARGHRGLKPDPEKSWRVCQAAVKADLAEGYACTGGHYYFGFHVKQDRPEAAKWFRIAADRGFGEAMVDLGIMLWSGDGVARDEDAAITYWRAAKRAGEARGDEKLRAHLSGWRYFARVTVPDFWAEALVTPLRRTWDGIRALLGW
jgi:tetratricopeptide (TPR) repeat protein